MPPKRKVLVALLTEKQGFQQLLAEDARAAGVRTGLEVEVVWAENNPVIQLRQIHDAVRAPSADRPAAVIIAPVAAAGLDGAGRAALSAGVGWVLLGDRANLVEPLQQEHPDMLVCCAGTDNEAIGRLQAAIARALLPRGGGMVSVEGPSVSASVIRRRKRMEEGLAGSGIQILKVLAGDWTAATTERAATVEELRPAKD